MDTVPMTATSYERLQEELKTLKSVERPAVIRALEEARAHGDLSENAEYHAARERQSFNEGRVAELEDKLRRAVVIDVSKLSGKVIKFGATVRVADEDTDEEATYQQGTDTRTDRLRVFDQRVFHREDFEIMPGEPFEDRCRFEIPSGSMHSFKSDNNEISWKLIVRGDVARWPAYERSFPIVVAPSRPPEDKA